MVQLPLVLVYHGPLRIRHLLGVETAIYFYYGVCQTPCGKKGQMMHTVTVL